MKEKRKLDTTEKRLLSACIFFATAGILMVCARQIAGFAEWYSVHIYKILTTLFGRVTGMAPFSIVEFGLYVFLLWIPVSGIWMIIKAVHSEQKRCAGTSLGIRSISHGIYIAISIYCKLWSQLSKGIFFGESWNFNSTVYNRGVEKCLCMAD